METRKPSAKLSLDLDELVVHTFETDDAAGEGRGTVHGHATLVCTDQLACSYWQCGVNTYPFCTQHDQSCGATCGGVCGPQTYAMHSCYDWQCDPFAI